MSPVRTRPTPFGNQHGENRRQRGGAGIAHEVKCEDDLHAAAIGADHLGIGQKAEQEEISPCEPKDMSRLRPSGSA